MIHTAGPSWQTARPPYEVQFRCCLANMQPDMVLPGDEAVQWHACKLVLGQGHLPPGVETAVQSMPEGEAATFIMPRAHLHPESAHSPGVLPAPPASSQNFCLLHIRMDAFVEVRDMAGDGKARCCLPAGCACVAPGDVAIRFQSESVCEFCPIKSAYDLPAHLHQAWLHAHSCVASESSHVDGTSCSRYAWVMPQLMRSRMRAAAEAHPTARHRRVSS